MQPIRNIFIVHQKGMEELVPYVEEAIKEMMDCFPQYKQYFPIKNLGDWKSESNYIFKEGKFCLAPHESMEWYLERAKQNAKNEGRWQSRKQISVAQMYEDLANDPYAKKIPQWGIYLTMHDLYGGSASNFCLGVTKADAFSIISTKRFLDRHNQLNIDNFQTTVQHEFGHILRLTEGDHPNIEESLGPHCTDPNCVMQQRLSGDMSDITERRLSRKEQGLPPICSDCITQGRRTLFKLYAKHEKQFGPNTANPNTGR